MAAEGMQSHDQSCGNCPTASHPASKKGRINAPILPKPARCAKSDRLLVTTVRGYWIASKSDVSDFDNLMPKSGRPDFGSSRAMTFRGLTESKNAIMRSITAAEAGAH